MLSRRRPLDHLTIRSGITVGEGADAPGRGRRDRRPETPAPASATRTRRFLVGLTAGMGVLHAVLPERFDAIVPRALPGPARLYTEASGVAEVAVAGLLAAPRTRRLGGAAAIALFVAVFPANVQMAWDWRHDSAARRAVAIGRLPLQALLIAQAARVMRAARDAQRS